MLKINNRKDAWIYASGALLILLATIATILILINSFSNKLNLFVKNTSKEITTEKLVTKKKTVVKPVVHLNENPTYDISLAPELQKFTINLCNKYGIKPEIAFAIMWRESRFNADAINGKSVGIMQINRINYDELNEKLSITDLSNPHQNIESGIYIFSKLLNKYGDYHKALVCYNCGETGAKGILTSNYSISVMNYANRLEVR